MFLTVDPSVAASWAQIRETGVFVFTTPQSIYDDLVQVGGIAPDPAYSSHSFVVFPHAIPSFVSGSNIEFVPVTSKRFYDEFYK